MKFSSYLIMFILTLLILAGCDQIDFSPDSSSAVVSENIGLDSISEMGHDWLDAITEVRKLLFTYDDIIGNGTLYFCVGENINEPYIYYSNCDNNYQRINVNIPAGLSCREVIPISATSDGEFGTIRFTLLLESKEGDAYYIVYKQCDSSKTNEQFKFEFDGFDVSPEYSYIPSTWNDVKDESFKERNVWQCFNRELDDLGDYVRLQIIPTLGEMSISIGFIRDSEAKKIYNGKYFVDKNGIYNAQLLDNNGINYELKFRLVSNVEYPSAIFHYGIIFNILSSDLDITDTLSTIEQFPLFEDRHEPRKSFDDYVMYSEDGEKFTFPKSEEYLALNNAIAQYFKKGSIIKLHISNAILDISYSSAESSSESVDWEIHQIEYGGRKYPIDTMKYLAGNFVVNFIEANGVFIYQNISNNNFGTVLMMDDGNMTELYLSDDKYSVSLYRGESGELRYRKIDTVMTNPICDRWYEGYLTSRDQYWSEDGTVTVRNGNLDFMCENVYTVSDYFIDQGTTIDAWFADLKSQYLSIEDFFEAQVKQKIKIIY